MARIPDYVQVITTPKGATRYQVRIEASQIVQESVGRVVLKVVRDVDYAPQDEALLVRHAQERLGPAMESQWSTRRGFRARQTGNSSRWSGWRSGEWSGTNESPSATTKSVGGQ